MCCFIERQQISGQLDAFDHRSLRCCAGETSGHDLATIEAPLVVERPAVDQPTGALAPLAAAPVRADTNGGVRGTSNGSSIANHPSTVAARGGRELVVAVASNGATAPAPAPAPTVAVTPPPAEPARAAHVEQLTITTEALV